MEDLGLGKTVLAGRGVEHKQNLRSGPRQPAIDDAAHLGQLVHQVGLGVEPPGGVRDDDVDAAGHGCIQGVEDHGRGIGTGSVGNELAARSVCPDSKLIDRGGTESVGRGQKHRAALGAVAMGELANRRRLAGAVYADHEDDRRLALRAALRAPVGVARDQ